MRLSLLLALLAAPALAQGQSDPRRISPVTGEPRPMFEPTSSEEHELVLDACIAREMAAAPATEAVATCHGEALANCEAIMALYPLARNECALGVKLAWSDVRFAADRRIVDGLYARGDAASIEAVEAFALADEAWRLENREACEIPDPAGREACELRREMDRAALYLARAAELGL